MEVPLALLDKDMKPIAAKEEVINRDAGGPFQTGETRCGELGDHFVFPA
jgi:hypothetical protein